MKSLGRRSFLTASAAALGATCLRPAYGFAAVALQDSSRSDWPPQALLASVFGPLKDSLLPAERWAPYPKAAERTGWTGLPQDVRESVVRRADAANVGPWPSLLATDELEFQRNGNRSRFEHLHFTRRARLGDLVLGECVSAQGRYLDQMANGVWLICEESFWGLPAHLGVQHAGVGLADEAEPIIDLFAAETAATLSWIVYLLAAELQGVSPRLVPRIQMEAERRILTPAAQRNDFSWMGLNGRPHHLNNWNPWINSNLLTTALLLETDAVQRAAIVAKCCRSLDGFIGDYSPDGGCEEGTNYWQRSAGSFFDCCWTLVSAHGGKGAAVLHHPFVRAMGHYIADVHIAKDLYVNYGDAHPSSAPQPELVYRFGHETGDTELAAFGAFDAVERGLASSGPTLQAAIGPEDGGSVSLSRTLAALFVAREIRTATRRDALPQDAWYPHLGLAIAREREGSASGFFLALQAGGNGRNHGHNDTGSFIVFHNGEPIFIDVGVGVYEAKTFSKDRFSIWTMQSGSHNLPMIGGVMQANGVQYRATDLHYKKSAERSGLEADLAMAYPEAAGVQHWARNMALDRKQGKIVLQETFALRQARPVTLVFMTARTPAVQDEQVVLGDVALRFDAAQLTGASERIALTDANLRSEWGEAIYRVTLSSRAPVANGNWGLEICKK